MTATPMVKMTALKPHRIARRQVAVGETYEVSRQEARVLAALGRSRASDEPAEVAGGPGRYNRRDMRAAETPSAPAPPASGDAALGRLTNAELFAIAKDEGIAVEEGDHKADLVRKISQARAKA